MKFSGDMKLNEQYDIWEPEQGCSYRFEVDSLLQNNYGLTIFLKKNLDGSNRALKIYFDAHVGYVNVDESYRARTFEEWGGFEKSLYIVRNSRLITLLQSESLGFYKDVDINHYAIFTSSDCIDILSEFPPEVTWVSKEDK